MNWMPFFYALILVLILAVPIWADTGLPSLGTELGTDLIRWNERPKTNSPEDLSRSFSQMFLEQVYLKNFMKTPDVFKPDAESESAVPASNPMYGELMRKAMAQELAKTDQLHLQARLLPYFEKRQNQKMKVIRN